jgi:hypothetical protein
VSDQPRQLPERRFTDGGTRPGFEGAGGRQYVEDGGDRIYGSWLPPSDEPVLVTGPDGS